MTAKPASSAFSLRPQKRSMRRGLLVAPCSAATKGNGAAPSHFAETCPEYQRSRPATVSARLKSAPGSGRSIMTDSLRFQREQFAVLPRGDGFDRLDVNGDLN